LRIAVNSELEREERGLALAASMLAPSGILVVISFHSLEDRIAKLLCRDCGRNKGYQELCKTPRVPNDEERAMNPPSRSAKLRALRAPSAEGPAADGDKRGYAKAKGARA
jgi:16S rRNA (cytosine1402-N4)-methyltransferase